jgi:hypothetical protein
MPIMMWSTIHCALEKNTIKSQRTTLATKPLYFHENNFKFLQNCSEIGNIYMTIAKSSRKR